MSARAQYSQQVVDRALALYDRTKSFEKASTQLRKEGTPVSARNIRHWSKHRKDGSSPARSPTKNEFLKRLAELMTQHGPEISFTHFCTIEHTGGVWRNYFKTWPECRREALLLVPEEIKTKPERVFNTLKNSPLTLDELAKALSVNQNAALRAVERSRANGYNIHLRGDHFNIESAPIQLQFDPKIHVCETDSSGTIRVGFVSDNHIGSKYARLDVLHDLYDFFQKEGITRVYNCGNWIDGEARFNRYDLEPWAHGMDEQIRGFVKHYPRRDGITTYYVAGDDHEGWYDGVDIGLRAQQSAIDAGRKDLRYLGYMEAFIRLKHKRYGGSSVMSVVHPGGGSAYAISYSPQKIVESYQGGEKPAVVALGHYHKMDVFNYRNVWILQVGCTQDQTPFMRKKRIEAHVGGILAEFRIDERGAVTDCITHQKRYFDRGYHNFQFDRAGPLKRLPLAA